jgi:acyl carrier protein
LIKLVQTQRQIDLRQATADTGLADAGLDSLTGAELLFSIEEAVNVDLGDIQANQMPATLGELVSIIDRKRR